MEFEPEAFRELREPSQIKACADPLRMRLLQVLAARGATNQQVATELGESPAKVFHHLHVLLDAELITLVETRIRGKNVEYFYRAVARHFLLRPGADVLPETRLAALGAELDRVRHEALQSAATGVPDSLRLLRQEARLRPDQLAAFHQALQTLIHTFWDETSDEAVELPRTVLTVLTVTEPVPTGTRQEPVDA